MHRTNSVHYIVRETFLDIVADIVPSITLYPITAQQHQLHHFCLGGSSLEKKNY